MADVSEWKSWNWRSEGDLMMNGAYFVESGDPAVVEKSRRELNLIKAAKGIEVTMITKFAGVISCQQGKPC